MAKKELEKVALTSKPILNENLQKLRDTFPQFVKDGEVDFDAVQVFFDKEGVLAGSEKYGLSWAGKSDALRAIRIPATGTLVPQEKESRDWDKTQSIFIEGDNLEVLKLLQAQYRGAIQMIYIDPPYNTGKDFIYKDNFTEDKSDYYERTGQSKDGIKLTTNLESNGRYHSDWLTMMYPRLFLAKNLLKDDGVIFISIDDNEVANLRLVMDEIFDAKCFLGRITWINRTKPKNIGDAKYSLQQNTEYILVYSKDPDFPGFILPETYKKIYPFNKAGRTYRLEEIQQRKNLGSMRRNSMVYEVLGITPRENYRWQLSPKERDLLLKEGKLIKEGQRIYQIIFSDEEGESAHEPFWSHREDCGTAESAKEALETLMGVDDIFDTVKPTELIQQLLCFMPKDAIVLDFFSGSGTTAHAVMAQNAEDTGSRKWLCAQLQETTDEDGEAYKAGYKTITEIARERIRRAGDKIGKGDLGFKAFTLEKSNYRQWNVLTEKDDETLLRAQMKMFLERPLVDKYDEKTVVHEILLKEGFSLNAEVSQDKRGVLKAWVVTDSERRLVVTFAEKVGKKDVEGLALSGKDLFVCLDSALDDTTKVNISRNLNVKVI